MPDPARDQPDRPADRPLDGVEGQKIRVEMEVTRAFKRGTFVEVWGVVGNGYEVMATLTVLEAVQSGLLSLTALEPPAPPDPPLRALRRDRPRRPARRDDL